MFNTSNLYNSEWLALVFQNRNKNYGAYALRMESSTIMAKALLVVIPVFVLLFVAPSMVAHFNPKAVVAEQEVLKITDVDVVYEMKPVVEKIEEKKKELPKPAPLLEKAKTVNMSSNIVVTDQPVLQDPVKTADLATAVIASVTQTGIQGLGNAKPDLKGDGELDVKGKGEGGDNVIHNVATVEKYPEFPGGMEAWAKFIQKNLKYPYIAQETGIQGKVFLSFVVERDGSITDVSVVKGIGGGCDEEALRVIKKSPKWTAGKQNNNTVRVRYNMPINYTLNQ